MGSDLTKRLIIILLMATLAFVVGSNAADGRLQASMMPVTAIVGAFVFIYLGSRCWWLIFLVPALQSFLPIQSIFGLPLAQLVTAAVFTYWCLMSTMGYVRVQWRSLIWLDVPVIVFFLYFAFTFYLNPVSIAVLGDDGDMVGGKDYVFMALAAVSYCAISSIPCTIGQLCRVVKWTIWISVALTLFNSLRGGAQLGSRLVSAAFNTGRFTMFSGLGWIGVRCLCAWNSPLQIILSFPKLIATLACVAFIAIGGWREMLLSLVVFAVVWAVVCRQLWVLVSAGLVTLASIYYLSSEGILLKAPRGMQRVLTVIPGLKLDRDIKQGASHSSAWRVQMWKWALDPRMGYIKDYVWGDGFGVSRTMVRRNSINIMRGRMIYGEQSFFAEAGVWHSGVISSIHRIGYVGLTFDVLWSLAGLMVVLRLCFHLYGKKEFPYALYSTSSYAGSVVLFYVSAGTFSEFFSSTVTLALAKVFYVEAMKEGLIPPMFSRRKYVPFMLRDEELQRLRVARRSTVASSSSDSADKG